jgi:hypothetical protein
METDSNFGIKITHDRLILSLQKLSDRTLERVSRMDRNVLIQRMASDILTARIIERHNQELGLRW